MFPFVFTSLVVYSLAKLCVRDFFRRLYFPGFGGSKQFFGACFVSLSGYLSISLRKRCIVTTTCWT